MPDHCKHGHNLAEVGIYDATVTLANGRTKKWRACAECKRISARERQAKRRQFCEKGHEYAVVGVRIVTRTYKGKPQKVRRCAACVDNVAAITRERNQRARERTRTHASSRGLNAVERILELHAQAQLEPHWVRDELLEQAQQIAREAGL